MSEEDKDYLEGEQKDETSDDDQNYSPDQKEDQDEAKEKRKSQQDEGNRQENLRLRNLLVEAEVAKAKNDGNSLKNLHDTDPKIAESVAKKFWYDSYDEAIKAYEKWVKGDWLNDQKPESSEKDFEKWYQKRKTEETHVEAMAKAEKLLNKIKDEELQKEAKVYFDKMSKWKKLTIEEAEEFADMATLYVNKETIKSERYSKWLADLASSWVSASKKWGKADEDNRVIQNGKMVFLDSNNTK